MIGDSPQPGEKPANEGNPWSFSDPGSGWWRGETDRSATDPPTARGRHRAPSTTLPTPTPPKTYAGEAAEAHEAGTKDVVEELAPAEPVMVERDHDQADPHRYDPLEPPAGHTAKLTAGTVAADSGPEPDVMVLPEPSPRNRPTVPLTAMTRQNRGQAPAEPLPRPTGRPDTDARLDRLENHPFWRNDPESADPAAPRAGRPGVRHPAPPSPRRTVASLIALIALGLLASFFAWVSAEPFWLALGHGDKGYATVTRCSGDGVTQHCEGRFAAADGGFTITRVTLLGVGPGERVPGTIASARMISPDSPRAYLGDTSPLLQLRWLLGFVLILFCGYTIAGVTGARRLPTGRHRRTAVLASLAGPLLLLGGFLIAAY